MQPNKANKPKPARPQNKSCPAGGSRNQNPSQRQTNSAGQRGVVVAPPSGNTPHIPDMTILHKGFDTIALSIKAKLTPDFLLFLEGEQNRAKTDNAPVLCTYGGVAFHLKHHGGSGYQFLLDGGPDGASWAFKHPHPKDPWGIRVNIGSRFLALNGLGRAKAHVEDTLAAWGIRFQGDDVSIARVDFCIDVFAPTFVLEPEQFVMHSGTGRRDHVANPDLAVHGKSGRVTSVTLGKMPNRQVILYDKRAEVIARSKTYWWAIWNQTLRTNGLPQLHYPTVQGKHNGDAADGNLPYVGIEPYTGAEPYVGTLLYADGPATMIDARDPDLSRIWRIEFRAGKNHLKDTWGIRTWAQLFDKFGDLIRHTGEVVRYTAPNGDPNRSRWPNHLLWEIVCAEMNDDLTEMRSGADPNPMKEVHKATHISLIMGQAFGLSVTLGGLRGATYEELPSVIDDLAEAFKETVRQEQEDTAKKLQNAKERYVFLSEKKKP